MSEEQVTAVMARLEAPDGPAAADYRDAAGIAAAAFPGRPLWPGAEAGQAAETDAVLALVDASLPSWAIHVQGSSATRAGRWTCTIRETGVRDDDELIGVGKARELAAAVLSAFLKIIELRGERG